MRQIKFRGKRLDNGEWVIGDLITYESGQCAIMCKQFTKIGCEATEIARRIEVNPATVGQFTGLRDKNGTEIYEGDIIQHGYMSYQYRIEYINSGFMCCKRPGEVCFSLFEADLHQVIGNIYNNPELKTE